MAVALTPPVCPRLRRAACGVAVLPKDRAASSTDSLRLSERSSRSERSEFRSEPRNRHDAGCPQRSGGSRTFGSPLLCLLSFGETKESRSAAGSRPGLEKQPPGRGRNEQQQGQERATAGDGPVQDSLNNLPPTKSTNALTLGDNCRLDAHSAENCPVCVRSSASTRCSSPRPSASRARKSGI